MSQISTGGWVMGSMVRIHHLTLDENLNQSDTALVSFSNFSINNLPLQEEVGAIMVSENSPLDP